MSSKNNNNLNDYQTVLEEQTPLVCNDAVEDKSSSTRLVTLLSIGIAVFAFLAMSGQYVSHASISELKAALADHQSQLQALTVQSTSLLGSALQGSAAVGDACDADSECGSKLCKTKRNAFCVASPATPLYSPCEKGGECSSGYCSLRNICAEKGKIGYGCNSDEGCESGYCRISSYLGNSCREPWV